MSVPTSEALPLSIVNNRRLDKWLRFQPDRTVRLAVGKVEIGQGVLIALSQIAAEELDVALDRIDILLGDTQDAPDEGSTSSSQSIEVSGRSVRLVSAELRARVLRRLAQRLNCAPEDLTVDDGLFLRDGNPTGFDYWSFAGPEDFAADIEGSAMPKPPAAYKVVGQPVPRRDLLAKVTGAAFIHDMVRPDMLHGRALRQPSHGARLVSLDEAAVRRAAKGDIEIIRVGEFVAFVGADETVVQRAAVAAPAHTVWSGARALTPAMQEASWFTTQPADDRFFGDAGPPAETGTIVSQTYARPFVAHAAVAPSCGLAEFREGHLSVWSHTQGVYPLRNSLADILGLKRDQVTVRHAHGAGCYGHNGADDAALDAAVIAMQKPGKCIQVQWRREEEFGFEPVSTAHMTRIRAALDDAGRYPCWPVLDPQPGTLSLPNRFADGGNLENTGIASLLAYSDIEHHRLHQFVRATAAWDLWRRRWKWRVYPGYERHHRRQHPTIVRLPALWPGKARKRYGRPRARPDFRQQPGLRPGRLPRPAAGTVGGERPRNPCLSRSLQPASRGTAEPVVRHHRRPRSDSDLELSRLCRQLGGVV